MANGDDDLLLLEGYHRLEYATRNGFPTMDVTFFYPWDTITGRKMTDAQLLEMKQLRNFTESNRQNDGMYSFIFSQPGDLHVLMTLINHWPQFENNHQAFLASSLVTGLSLASVRKFYTMAKFFLEPEKEISLKILQTWLEKHKASRFSRGHLEASEFRDLPEKYRVIVLTKYMSHKMKYYSLSFY
jgi:hypothetical protein